MMKSNGKEHDCKYVQIEGGQSHGDVQKHLVKREEKRKEVKGV